MKNAPDLELSLLARQWGATAAPFAELSAQAWLKTDANQRALALLQQTAALRSLMLLSGANGSGKSAVLNHWLASLDRRLFHPLLLTQATLSGSGLLWALTSKLGKVARCQRALNLRLIEEALLELGKIVPLIILDDAQNLAYGSLEEVRLLLGLNLAQPPAFALILAGDEYLLGSLRLRQHRSLYSRIACHFTLRAWNAEEAAQYLQQGLEAVGVHRQAFEAASVDLMVSASGGLARSLSLLARAAWIEAARAGEQNIRPEHVQAAMESVPAAATISSPSEAAAS